jgi:hypothetical protein
LAAGFHTRLRLVVSMRANGSPRSAFHGEADFDGHLPVIHLSLVDIAARFNHLKPAKVFDGFVRALNGLVNGILDGSGRGAGEFDEFIDWVFHVRFFVFSRRQWVLPFSLSAHKLRAGPIFRYGV